ncbi:MAG: isopentenyl-diphosphate Delta-isomerase [Woeseiaceae bacterium]
MNEHSRKVSSESEELILVDRDDRETGYLSKAYCHDGDGVLHRAFSLFLFNDSGELMLQKRAGQKRLWPGYWSNSCCSHPRRGESMETATMRRLSDELNAKADLEYVYQFCYTANFGNVGSENELCHVYLGSLAGDVWPNDSEISDIRFISASDVEKELSRSPELFTPWFKQEWRELNHNYSETLSKYCGDLKS